MISETPDTTLYVVPQTLRWRPTPSGALQVHPLTEAAPAVPRDLLPLLLLFASPRTVDGAFAQASIDWEMERGEFDRLVDMWIGSRLLSRAQSHDGHCLSRLSLFKETIEEYRADPRRPFPLRSHFNLQRPRLFYPGLNTRELHDLEAFRWVLALEAAYPAIKEELLALLGRNGEWAAAYLWVFGEEVESVVTQCPETARALRQAPGVTSFGTITFSALAPRTFLAPHYGDTNAKLRCQLPLIHTEAYRVKVADTEIKPKEGKCLIFDDSFLHSAWNEGNTVLYVLAFDFFHPDLSDAEVEYLSSLFSEPCL